MSANSTTTSPRSRRGEQAGTVLFYSIFGLLLFGPLAFGATEPWSIFLMEVGSAGLFLLWIAKQLLQDGMKLTWNPIFLPMGVFGLLVLSQLMFGSAYKHETESKALLYFAYGLLCFLAGQTLLRGSQARSLALIFSVYGAGLAGFALIYGISANDKLYWLRLPRNGGWIYGPYVNHNHYAGLMEMLVPIPLVLGLTQLASTRARTAAAAAAALMVGTIFLSGSRGGMLAIITELVIVAVLLVKQKRNLRTAVFVGVFLAIVVGFVLWVGGDAVVKRWASVSSSHSEISNDVRLNIDRDAFRMFLKKPLLGWGLGTFPVVYPQFRTFYTNSFVNEAHNDYLQLLAEMGLFGFGTMLWFLLTLYTRAVKKIGNWVGDLSGATALACMLGLSGILVHSAFDFNLQIPANAALFYVLCTIAAAEPFAQPARKRRMARSKPPEETLDSQEALSQPATNF
jgi:O-antigen ligase